jgi:hypothetical protein
MKYLYKNIGETMNEYIGTLMQSRTQAHIFHLQTTSYAKHKALNKYYEDIIDVIDGLVEAYQGKYEIITDYKMLGTLIDLETDDDIVKYFDQIARFCELKREKLPQDSYLKNHYDEVDSLIRSTLYKLKVLG